MRVRPQQHALRAGNRPEDACEREPEQRRVPSHLGEYSNSYAAGGARRDSVHRPPVNSAVSTAVLDVMSVAETGSRGADRATPGVTVDHPWSWTRAVCPGRGGAAGSSCEPERWDHAEG